MGQRHTTQRVPEETGLLWNPSDPRSPAAQGVARTPVNRRPVTDTVEDADVKDPRSPRLHRTPLRNFGVQKATIPISRTFLSLTEETRTELESQEVDGIQEAETSTDGLLGPDQKPVQEVVQERMQTPEIQPAPPTEVLDSLETIGSVTETALSLPAQKFDNAENFTVNIPRKTTAAAPSKDAPTRKAFGELTNSPRGLMMRMEAPSAKVKSRPSLPDAAYFLQHPVRGNTYTHTVVE